MPSYVCLIQFKDQGIRNIQDTVKRGDAAIAEAEKMGMNRNTGQRSLTMRSALWRRPTMRP